MPDLILIDGDQADFMPNFGAAVVVVRPGTLSASGPATLDGKSVCVEGDEASVSVPGCMYTTSQYCIPGTGTLEVDSLAADQVAQKTRTGGTPVMLVGSTFTAKFQVQSPAQQPTAASPVPDATPSYSGTGSFRTTNTHFQGT